jgi:hypothetical protein
VYPEKAGYWKSRSTIPTGNGAGESSGPDQLQDLFHEPLSFGFARGGQHGGAAAPNLPQGGSVQ